MVYLQAQRCSGGVLQAIKEKLHGFAQDETFLQSLIFSRALDVCIDGLNEVSPDTRAQVTSFVEHYFRSNCIIGTQPLEWDPPKNARTYVVQRLTREQIENFLVGREPFLPAGSARRSDDYRNACATYLAQVFGAAGTPGAEDIEKLLSNPMDLATVAELIARGENPNLLRLQEQQYRVMAADYRAINLREFPLKGFAEHCYDLRRADQVALSEELFMPELTPNYPHALA